MILGMSLGTFTQLHVIISLIAIVSGIAAVWGMFNAKGMTGITALFLITSVATSVTGLMFPTPFDAADVIGILSLVVLGLAIAALYAYHLAGAWRGIYVGSAVLALYLNCFVLLVQSFQKIPLFHALAPTQKEPPFAIAQGALLILFIGLGVVVFKKFRPLARARAAT